MLSTIIVTVVIMQHGQGACLELLLALEVMLSLHRSSLLRKGGSFCLSFCCNPLSFCNASCNLWSQLLCSTPKQVKLLRGNDMFCHSGCSPFSLSA